jgi:hypothetical protein
MSDDQQYQIWIFCRAKPAPVSAIAEFIEEGVYFDTDPDLALEDSLLRVQYAPDRAPVVIRGLADPAAVEAAKARAREALRSAEEEPEPAADARSSLDAATAAVAVEINRDNLTDEAWFMVDSVEACIAATCQGLVWAPGDGFYDASLQLVVQARDYS